MAETWEVQNPDPPTLENIPETWKGYTKAQKVQTLLDVVEDQLRMVRNGTFDVSKGVDVAALALEGQLALADFYSDAEARAKSAKHVAEYIEVEVASKIGKDALADGSKRLSEAALKRHSTASDEVKKAKQKAIDLEKEHKKWRCVYDILKEAHIFFRNISRE